MRNYHYVTTAPCTKCGETTELTLEGEDYLIFLERDDNSYDHIVCPKDVS
jgi:hypothetical protein